MNPFSPAYKKLDNLSLLKIIDAPADYNPEAIEAANEELTARQLTDDELAALREEISVQKQEQQLKSEKINTLKDKAKDALYTVTDSLNPIQSEKPSLPKAILWLSILMILAFLYQLYLQYGLLKYMFTYDTAKWDLTMAMYFIRPLVIMPVAAILFVLRKNTGWVLLSGYLTYLAINTIALEYIDFKYQPEPGISNPLDQLQSPAPSGSLAGWTIFIAGCLYFIYKKDVRDVYHITTKNILVAAVIGVLLMLSSMSGWIF